MLTEQDLKIVVFHNQLKKSLTKTSPLTEDNWGPKYKCNHGSIWTFKWFLNIIFLVWERKYLSQSLEFLQTCNWKSDGQESRNSGDSTNRLYLEICLTHFCIHCLQTVSFSVVHLQCHAETVTLQVVTYLRAGHPLMLQSIPQSAPLDVTCFTTDWTSLYFCWQGGLARPHQKEQTHSASWAWPQGHLRAAKQAQQSSTHSLCWHHQTLMGMSMRSALLIPFPVTCDHCGAPENSLGMLLTHLS